jgi:type VI secretion system secreted protein VgrG
MTATFTLTAGTFTADELSVVSFRAQEGVSELYRAEIRVTLAADLGDDLDAALLGQDACLVLTPGADAPRTVRGIVAAAKAEGGFLHDRRSYRLRIVPRLWRLKRRTASRIFQEKTVAEIVDVILGEHGIDHRWELKSTYATRPYCVQRDETDYRFITRLLADEGIFFMFDHPPDGGPETSEILVFADATSAYAPLEGGEHLAFQPAQEGIPPRDDQVTRFSAGRRVRSQAALVRDYDFRRPLAEARSAAVAADVAQAPTAADGSTDRAELSKAEEEQFSSAPAQTSLIYDHRGEQEERGLAPKTAAVLLEQERARVFTGEGEAWCRRLIPGRTFSLDNHPVSPLNQAYVLTSVEHEGYAAEVVPSGRHTYQARFACAPAAVRVRPRRTKRKPHQVTETAIVVGPTDQEIYTDEHGRIKVRFHWDLEGKRDEKSSCWMRVAQAWAGAAWGTQFLPRVGREVPDRTRSREAKPRDARRRASA